MSDFIDKVLVLAQKCDDRGLENTASLFDKILEKIAAAVVISITEDPSQNQWLGVTNESPPKLTVSSPIYNPAPDHSPENHQRGMQTMRAELHKQLAQTYPQGTHFEFRPPQFG